MTRFALSDRIRNAVSCKCATVKAVLEQVHKCVNVVIEEEMTEHIGARHHREKTDARTAQEIEDFCGGEHNGSYSCNLIIPVGKIEQLRQENRLKPISLCATGSRGYFHYGSL